MRDSRLGFILIRLNFATEQEIVQAVSSQLGVPVATFVGKEIPESSGRCFFVRGHERSKAR